MALRRMASRRSLALKAANARRTPPRNDSVEGRSNRKPVSPSVMVSASPPVWWPIGSDPNRCAYIWLRPQGSNRDGIRVKSLPAKIRRAWPSLKPMATPIASGRRRCASTSACSMAGSPLPVTMIWPPAAMISSAADSTRSTPFWCTSRATKPKIGPRDSASPNCLRT